MQVTAPLTSSDVSTNGTARLRSLGMEPLDPCMPHDMWWKRVDWSAVDAQMNAFMAALPKPTPEEIDAERIAQARKRRERHAARGELRISSPGNVQWDDYGDRNEGCDYQAGSEIIHTESGQMEIPA